MRQKKIKQLRKMTEIKLDENGTKFINKKQYRALANPSVKDDALYRSYKNMYKEAKRNYSKMSTYVKERLGEEWVADIADCG